MTYDFVHSVCDKSGMAVDVQRLTAFVVSRDRRLVGPWRRVGAWVPVGKTGWAFVGRRK